MTRFYAVIHALLILFTSTVAADELAVFMQYTLRARRLCAAGGTAAQYAIRRAACIWVILRPVLLNEEVVTTVPLNICAQADCLCLSCQVITNGTIAAIQMKRGNSGRAI